MRTTLVETCPIHSTDVERLPRPGHSRPRSGPPRWCYPELARMRTHCEGDRERLGAASRVQVPCGWSWWHSGRRRRGGRPRRQRRSGRRLRRAEGDAVTTRDGARCPQPRGLLRRTQPLLSDRRAVWRWRPVDAAPAARRRGAVDSVICVRNAVSAAGLQWRHP